MNRLDYVPGTEYKIIQNSSEFSFSIDSLILSYFARVRGVVGDLGSGTGILGLRIVDRVDKVVNFEIQEDIFNLAEETIKLNNLGEKITQYNVDIGNLDSIFLSNSFDSIIINPPYFKESLASSKETHRISKHGNNLESFVYWGMYLLKNNGTFNIILSQYRIDELLHLMWKYKIYPKRIEIVEYSPTKRVVFVEGRKGVNPGINKINRFSLEDIRNRVYTIK